MSAGCVRWLLSRTVGSVCGGSPGCWTPSSRFTVCSERANIVASSWRWSPFSTAGSDTVPPPKKTKQDPQVHTINFVGRRIPHRHIQVISNTGEDLGVMHRAEVIQILDQQGLKLVELRPNEDPPVYQLMTGKQMYEERMKLQNKLKNRPSPVQVKELTFRTAIAAHDLSIKLKQVQSWLDKKHHVRLTLKLRRGETADNQVVTLEGMVQQIGVMVGFVSKPQIIRGGQAVMCVIRPPSAKELSQKGNKEKTASQTDNADSKATPSKTDSNTDTTETTDTLQQ